MAVLTHPHICTLHDVGRDGDTDFLVMELLEGQPLAKLKAPAETSVALSSLPTRDPATVPGVVAGTAPYMAPEQLEGKQTDARTGIFAFGCALYEMVTGRRAFAGQTEAGIITAIMSCEPPALSALQPMTPPALDRLVHRRLAKDPDARWQHAADVAGGLAYTGRVEFGLHRVLTVTTASAHAAATSAREYWRGRPAEERLAAVEFLRRQHDGTGARLRRVLELVDRPRG